MKIEHTDNGLKGAFYIGGTGDLQAEMSYIWAGNEKIIIEHTQVNPELKGQGIGGKLLDEIVAFAREKKIKVLPLCPFAQAQFEKNSQYKDVLF